MHLRLLLVSSCLALSLNLWFAAALTKDDRFSDVDGPSAEKIRRVKLKHSFQLARVKGRHR